MTTTLWLAGTHGTQLTEAERAAGIEAAARVLGEADPARAHAEYMALIDSGDQDAIAAHPWSRAEDAAIRAATAGWYRTPEDLALELG